MKEAMGYLSVPLILFKTMSPKLTQIVARGRIPCLV